MYGPIKNFTRFSITILLLSCSSFKSSFGTYEFKEDAEIGSWLDVSDVFPVLSASSDSVILIPSSDGVELSTWFKVDIEAYDGSASNIGSRIILTTISLLDRETFCPRNTANSLPCTLTLAVFVPSTSNTLEFGVVVSDVNDNTPRFAASNITIFVSESAKVASRYKLPGARDADEANNGVQGYHLKDVTNYSTGDKKTASVATSTANSAMDVNNDNITKSSPFRLIDASDEGVPMLHITSPLDRELRSSYSLLLTCKDRGGLTSKPLTIDVKITDVDDNSPRFRSARQPDIRVSEDLAPETIIAQVTALDADLEATVAYILISVITGDEETDSSARPSSIMGGVSASPALAPQSPMASDVFSVDGTSGIVTLLKPLDYETNPMYTLTIQASLYVYK